MTRRLACSLLFTASFLSAQTVRIETTLGAVDVKLAPEKAPATVRNFLAYVNAGAYTGGRFRRTVLPDNQPASNVKIVVVQAGVRF